MYKLVLGVINFHENVLPGLVDQFAQLAQGQSPDALMIACSDSRVAPNLFASTNPGDMFVDRNPGNMIPPYRPEKDNPNCESQAVAIEMAVESLNVKDIIVCGHSQCGGVTALMRGEGSPGVRRWVEHGRQAKLWLEEGKALDASLSMVDQLSQLNVLAQLDNLSSYPWVKNRQLAGALRVHGWWFDIAAGNVYNLQFENRRFVVIDQEEGQRILERISA